jgi:hypothetical protein
MFLSISNNRYQIHRTVSRSHNDVSFLFSDHLREIILIKKVLQPENSFHTPVKRLQKTTRNTIRRDVSIGMMVTHQNRWPANALSP